ncbi:unnamed protein product [Effrenium voratum]|uniref:Prolyl 4-hydroxylase alpha subunit domain-containing protein n=1 Tax=Effrenium voratum TaxID=2562239 RepID=A0AA36JKM6_9DINO|nr:unnamed protein product [Effrenium voratum]CAJ1458385.1 unnamed protein product [Effrenium voratum]
MAEPGQWQHAWAKQALTGDAVRQLQEKGFCHLPGAFDADLASACLEECRKLDDASATTVTTNRCNRGSRSAWLDLSSEDSAALHQLPKLTELSRMLAGLPWELQNSGFEDLRVHPATMLAVYPEQAASYALHKDSYAPADNDPATGATRRLTVLAYFNEAREGDGGQLRVHEAAKDKPDPRKFEALEPKAWAPGL